MPTGALCGIFAAPFTNLPRSVLGRPRNRPSQILAPKIQSPAGSGGVTSTLSDPPYLEELTGHVGILFLPADSPERLPWVFWLRSHVCWEASSARTFFVPRPNPWRLDRVCGSLTGSRLDAWKSGVVTVRSLHHSSLHGTETIDYLAQLYHGIRPRVPL